ncbi:thiamine pyrophosphate-dependent enzyme [Bradyrhizobium sp. 160]|uniref:thiamine pyrophosphate-dependent enzyme n=1 Tax=Bradyrhizobium sp. 160 TaxID=2782634 RepID=UPI001FFA1B95|nr:thiamine pyrophosphate-dependent enzyme [Bradyrhizobium sp. 160]
MTGNELARTVARGANLKIVVSNNWSYGTNRSHQERAFPDRPYGTDLSNPDFAALAPAFGATGFVIEDAERAPSTVAEAMTTKGPVVSRYARTCARRSINRSPLQDEANSD